MQKNDGQMSQPGTSLIQYINEERRHISNEEQQIFKYNKSYQIIISTTF